MRILVTAGGTREYIDPVRFISNASTGKMGYAIAQAALEAGHDVTLISAPVSLAVPQGADVIDVITSEDMFEAVKANINNFDCLIMAAAVSDYRPKISSDKKIKKEQAELTIELEPTTDILKWVGEHKRKQIIVGFALEDTNLLENAQSKMTAKKMDMIVANSPAAISADSSQVHIKIASEDWQTIPTTTKNITAAAIIKIIEGIRHQ
ncbi:MAG: phosphopantothenoylcysteine decarboxylase [Sedimentisphaeraceae bacterium JB056]